MSYNEDYDNWKNDPASFWEKKAKNIHWTKKWDKVLDKSDPRSWSWFPGGELNTCYNCLDIHIANGNGDKNALIYDSPITDTKKSYTYNELLDKTIKIASALKSHGVNKGDRVLIYMPMIPEAVASMLACARIGAVHVVVFGGFAPNELATRINDAKPKVLLQAHVVLNQEKLLNINL